MLQNQSPMHPEERAVKPRRALVKVQSVEVRHLTSGDYGGKTIGGQVDEFLREVALSGRIPNRVSIDLMPPRDDEETLADMS